MGKMTADELRRAGEAYRSENNGAQKSPVTVSANTEGSGNKMTASELRQAGEAYRKANGLSDPIYRESPATAVDKYSTPSTQPTQAAPTTTPSTQPTQAAPAGASSRKQSDVMQEQVDALKKQRDDAAIKAGAYMRAGNMQQQAKEQQKIANKAAIEYENAYTQWKNQRNAEAVEGYNPDENKFKAGDAALSGVQNAFQSMGQYAAAASSYLSGNQEAQAWEAKRLMDRLSYERRGVRVVKLENAYQMCSSSEMSAYITKALETRKSPKLSASQLETLTIIAYYQPATKAYVEQIRGVDSSYSVGVLLNKHLIEESGRLNVPGRPILYRTTPDFLRTFGLTSLDELPEIEKIQLGKRELPEEVQEETEHE